MSLVWFLVALFAALMVLLVVRAVQASSRPRWGRTTRWTPPAESPGTRAGGTVGVGSGAPSAPTSAVAPPGPAGLGAVSRPTYVPMVPAASAVSAAPARTTVGEIALGVALGLWLFTISAVLVSAVIGWLAGWGFARLV